MTRYGYAVIYDSQTAGFLELELMQMFRDAGYRIVGEKEVVRDHTIGVRYAAFAGGNSYNLTCTLEDVTTDKTLATIEANGRSSDFWTGATVPDKSDAHNRLREKLVELLSQYPAATDEELNTMTASESVVH